METKEALTKIKRLSESTRKKHEQYLDTKYLRDNAIREAIASGITMYAIGKHIGLSHGALQAIRDK